MWLILICALVHSSLEAALVTTKWGPVRGNDHGTYRNWQGVPFASPPLGKLRWKAPVYPSPWSDVKDCTNFTIACAQTAGSLDVPKNKSEDCLYLEVWAPPQHKYAGEPAAVMLFFYGGAFKEGGESFKIYDGAHIAATTNTIVVVTNYRIDVMGWLYTHKTDANVGLLDQRFSMQWVQDNIVAFGGDKDKVTIFGQSAGGQSVLIHLSCPEDPAASHFHRAIVESGPSLQYKTTAAGLTLAEVFALELGCHKDDLECMQSKDTQAVLKAGDKAVVVPLDVGSAIERWAPVVTGDASLPMQPLFAFEKGAIVKVPTMIGSNKNDGMLFGWALAPWNSTCHCTNPLPTYEYEAIVAGIFPNGYLGEVLRKYPPGADHDSRPVLSLLITDFLFACYSRHSLRMAEKYGVEATYLYQFSHHPPFCPWPKSQQMCCKDGAVCHGDEMAYLFQDSGAPFPWTFPPADLALSEAMTRYWASFAHFGDPNHFNANGTAEWPPYRAASDTSADLKWPLEMPSGLKKDVCDFFDTVGYYN